MRCLQMLFSNVKKNHGLLVETVEIVASEYPVVKDQFITFIRILPETCRITHTPYQNNLRLLRVTTIINKNEFDEKLLFRICGFYCHV